MPKTNPGPGFLATQEKEFLVFQDKALSWSIHIGKTEF